MNIRKAVIVAALGIAVASGPAVGMAQADPNPAPSPTPAPAPTQLIPVWVVPDAQKIVADAIRQAGHDPEYANETAERILGHYLP